MNPPYPIEFICYYNDLFRQYAALHFLRFHTFNSKCEIDYVDFIEELTLTASKIFYTQLSERKSSTKSSGDIQQKNNNF